MEYFYNNNNSNLSTSTSLNYNNYSLSSSSSSSHNNNNYNNNNNNNNSGENSSHSIQSIQSIVHYHSDNNSNYSNSNYNSYDDDDESNNTTTNGIIDDITSAYSLSSSSLLFPSSSLNYNPHDSHNGNNSNATTTDNSQNNNILTTNQTSLNTNSAAVSAVNLINSLSNLTLEEINKFQPLYIYEVRFKTSVENYTFHEKLNKGEMVTVQCERGYNIGFVDSEIVSNDENIPAKRILAKLLDEDHTIQDMLKYKITAEKNALSQCRLHCKGHRLGNFADAIAAEFQFDRKKLTVYLKKFEDVSVCRLVRKLYDTYKMRIKVLEVDDPETMKEMTKKYLELSKLNTPLSEAYNFDPNSSVLSAKSQGKSNKSDKQTPNYSKSHLGQSQHLIPSLVQYGPQAEKRHNTSLQSNVGSFNQHVLSHASTTTTPTNINSNFSPLNRADRHFDFPTYYGQDMYDAKYQQQQQNHHQQFHQHHHHHSNSMNPATVTQMSRNQYSTHSNISWSSTNPQNFNQQQHLQHQQPQHIGNTNNINHNNNNTNNNNIYGNNVNVNSHFNHHLNHQVVNMNINNGNNINNNINHHSNMTQKGAQPQSTYGRDRQNDKYNPSDNYPFATEPFGHDGSYMDESYRYQSNYKYQSNYNDSIFSEVPENYFPSQHDDQNFFRHHETFGLDASLPLSTDNLASLVAKYKSTNVSSTPNTISPSSQSSQTSFNYADIPF